MALLEVNDIHAHYGGIEALKGVSLSVDEGEVVTLIGSNGAGKSTTLRAITGLTPASSGSVVIDGEDITRVPAHEIVDRGIALVPGGTPLLLADDRAREPRSRRLPAPQRRERRAMTSSASSSCSRG